MTLTQLAYFVKIVETGHLTQTAKEFLIAQPSLTQSINKLESELGFPLFEKSGRRLVPTREGSEFYYYAKAVVDAQEKAHKAAQNIRRANRGLIRFMHTEPIPVDFIPGLIFGFLEREENREVRIESDVAATNKIYRELRNDEIDFGLCSKGADDADDLILYPLFKIPIVLIASRNDPLCKMGSIEPEELVRHPCVSYGTDSAMLHQIDGFWKDLGLEPDVRYRSSSVAIGKLVARGLGWAFAALTDAVPDEDIAVLPMPKLKMERAMYLAMRADRKPGPAAGRFLDYVLSYSEKYQ